MVSFCYLPTSQLASLLFCVGVFPLDVQLIGHVLLKKFIKVVLDVGHWRKRKWCWPWVTGEKESGAGRGSLEKKKVVLAVGHWRKRKWCWTWVTGEKESGAGRGSLEKRKWCWTNSFVFINILNS
ncbi:hypothetical protein BgiBS90_025059 [Biomphalaria glabrata]|nr:hypothetical protein BgiBS90_025059 [Biomphalaria glabrata]